MANETPETAWDIVEDAIGEYYNEKLDGTNTTYFKKDMHPALLNKNLADLKMFTFFMDDEPEIIQLQTKGASWCGWEMDGKIEAVFGDRSLAKRFSGLIKTHSPILMTDEVNGVAYCSPVSQNLSEVTEQFNADLTKGGEVRVWKLEMNMHVVFGNVRNN